MSFLGGIESAEVNAMRGANTGSKPTFEKDNTEITSFVAGPRLALVLGESRIRLELHRLSDQAIGYADS